MTRKLIVTGGTIVSAAVMAGFGVASAHDSRSAGYGYGYSPPPCSYDGYQGNCPSPANELSGIVYDRHAYEVNRCSMSDADAINAAKVPGASVQLLRRAAADGPFATVPPGSSLISPHVNPETTDSAGRYVWNVAAGTYEVVASMSGYKTGQSIVQSLPPSRPHTDIGLAKDGKPTGVTCHGPGGVGPSSGAEVHCKVPGLVHKKKTIVRTRLEASHCSLGRLTRRNSRAKRGTVVKQSPAAGSVRRANYPVNVVVSLGPKQKK